MAQQRFSPAVVTVGDELVMGERPTNNNERWLCAQLTERGHPARVVMQVRALAGFRSACA
jgi:molybdopterin-biosynthesis enzyme MoeA-like protein